MWKKLLALAVAVGIIAGGRYLYLNRDRLFRPDFSRTGGTLLVYEIDGEPPATLDEAVRVLQRRFDPTGALGIVVRANEGEVEISVPAGDRHDDQVEQIKRIIARKGRIEFHVLARTGDDDPAIKAAVEALKGPGSKDRVPPPAPKARDGKAVFMATLPGEPQRAYRWVRLSPSEVKILQLEDATLHRHNPTDLPHVNASLQTGGAFAPSQSADHLVTARKVPGSSDPVFFVLVREEPEDRAITAEQIDRVSVAQQGYGRHRGGWGLAASIRFTREGSNRFFVLNSENAGPGHGPTRSKKLAIILDDEVLSAPGIHVHFRNEAQISGVYTDDEVRDLVALIRSGTLPVRLKSKPVRETTIAPRK